MTRFEEVVCVVFRLFLATPLTVSYVVDDTVEPYGKVLVSLTTLVIS